MNQRIAFIVCFILGVIASGMNPFTNWLHETGHLQSFTQDGIPATITSQTTTMTDRVTPNGLASGSTSEFVFFFMILLIAYCVTNPHETNWRKAWFYLGIPFGACHNVFFRAFSYTDFNREWSGILSGEWMVIIGLILAVSWVVLIITRFIEQK